MSRVSLPQDVSAHVGFDDICSRRLYTLLLHAGPGCRCFRRRAQCVWRRVRGCPRRVFARCLRRSVSAVCRRRPVLPSGTQRGRTMRQLELFIAGVWIVTPSLACLDVIYMKWVYTLMDRGTTVEGTNEYLYVRKRQVLLNEYMYVRKKTRSIK